MKFDRRTSSSCIREESDFSSRRSHNTRAIRYIIGSSTARMQFNMRGSSSLEWMTLQVAMVLAILLPLASAADCQPGFYWDTILEKCFDCSEVCDPRYGTPEECARRPQCIGIVSEGLELYYKKDQVPPSPPPTPIRKGTVPPCIGQEPLLDKPLLIGLCVGMGIFIIATAGAAYALGVWMTKRNQEKTNDQEYNFPAQVTNDSSRSLLAPTGSSPDSSNNPSATSSSTSLDNPRHDPDQTQVMT